MGGIYQRSTKEFNVDIITSLLKAMGVEMQEGILGGMVWTQNSKSLGHI